VRDLTSDADLAISSTRAEYEASPAYNLERSLLVADALAGAIQKLAQTDSTTVVTILCAAAEDLGAGLPGLQKYHYDMVIDANFWANTATPHELAAYTAAGLAKVDRSAFALNTRKRLLVSLWNSLPSRDRARFLDFVDPGSAGKA